jgi:hypothetical protein
MESAACLRESAPPSETLQRLVAISGSYFCLPCLSDLITTNNGRDISARILALQTFRHCPLHQQAYSQRRCPHHRRWTDCLDCLGTSGDLRAGTSYCACGCGRRRGAMSQAGPDCVCDRSGPQCEPMLRDDYWSRPDLY